MALFFMSAAVFAQTPQSGRVPRIPTGEVTVDLDGWGNARVCLPESSICGQLGTATIVIDQPTDMGWGWHVRAWNTSGLASEQVSRVDGSACGDEDDCWFPDGYLFVLVNDQGGILTGQFRAEDHAPSIADLTLQILPSGRGALSVTFFSTCGGACLWWDWQLFKVLQSRSGYGLSSIVGPHRVGVQDAEPRETPDGVAEVCTMVRRAAPVFDETNSSVTVTHGFELMEETATIDVVSLSPEESLGQVQSSTPGTSPELTTVCEPLAP